MDTINLYVGNTSAGEKVYENLPVLALGDARYRLLVSPGLVLGVAKGDEIKLFEEDGNFVLLSRGRNLCVQLFITETASKEVDALASQMIELLNGTLDIRTDKQAVFSIPLESGFGGVEAVLNAFVDQNPGCEWYYGNVYDNVDGQTPLNWW